MANQYARQVLHHKEAPPTIEVRFFYTSTIPIDDPLSSLPPPMTAATAASRQPPKPFSEYDNAALDRAWLELRQSIFKYKEERGEKSSSNEGSRSRADSANIRDGKQPTRSRPVELKSKATRPAASSLSRVEGRSPNLPTSIDGLDGPSLGAEPSSLPDTTGTPFIRAPSRQKLNTHPSSKSKNQPARPKPHALDTYQWDDASHLAEDVQREVDKAPEELGPTQKVAVGASRLHQIEMPELVMTPIYWAPVHDTAQVVRATWFYQDTMLPVETPVANMLESGYVDLQVWTETWTDELDSAVEVGAIGEMKILHMLWPEKATPRSSRPSTSSAREDALNKVMTNQVNREPETPEEQRTKAVETACDLIDISTGPGGADNKASGISSWGRQGPLRMYASCGVVYANSREAHILKPSLQPSSYYGRRPLANYIRKGYKLGIPVVRGFDQQAWEKLHPSKTGPKKRAAEEGQSSSASGVPPNARRKTDPELAHSERPNVTDLVLVIHGIGQKLSERMESFHFTHAINAFRREVNVELASREMKPSLRKDMGGIMVLPCNWRHSLSFEEGGYRDGSSEDENANHFNLNDITPETLPSVRNIVSDVMLDIPYYLSHHQPRMIRAVTSELNRVYQLWCKNNPGFATHGRVHIIAHSLGSVMAIDILSRQPTTIPPELSDPTTLSTSKATNLDHLLFQTHNLYLCGSPAGFFLLLKKAALLPRLDNPSVTADPSTNTPQVCGDRDQYGSIPVENIYNVLNPYDPVSYRLNAAVDATYSASLKQAWVPSSTASWTAWFTGSNNANNNSTTNSFTAPPLPRLPSNVELETHNFTREEVAEKRMFALNDNGQIDFFLRYGGGPLEIQYLTMLGAHSSYWVLRDFVRLIVQETGRGRGREGTVMGMRAVKRREALGG
ncbi:hypothetical protein MBLNU230_g2261t1 [Neophaeotheca triangularis]